MLLQDSKVGWRKGEETNATSARSALQRFDYAVYRQAGLRVTPTLCCNPLTFADLPPALADVAVFPPLAG